MEERHPKLTRHVQARYGRSIEKLEEAADAVESMLSSEGWRHVQDILGDEAQIIESALDDSAPISQAEYAYVHGRKGGLKAAAQIAEIIRARHAAELARQRAKHEEEAPAESGAER